MTSAPTLKYVPSVHNPNKTTSVVWLELVTLKGLKEFQILS